MSQLSNLRAARAQKAQRRKFSTVSLSAPTGGWNARDSYAHMGPLDAVSMTNLFPSTTSVNLRNGFSNWATGLSGIAETLLVYSGGNHEKMFAATNAGSVYNVTASGAVGAPDITGLSNGRLEYVNMTTTGGSYIRWVNGSDPSEIYDGTTWTADGSGAPADITGVTSSTLSNIALFKNRMWFIKKNTLETWYLATGAVGGAATKFDLSGIPRNGGYLVALGTWTIDAGYGVDDLWVAVTNMGEVIVFRGTDPTSAATWALVGVWAIGAPIGNRPFLKYSGDLLYISQDGLLPMSGALQSSRTNPRVALTDKIQRAVSDAVDLYGSNFGWQLLYFPKVNQLYLNVPFQAGSNQQQFVMNTISRQWCNFTAWQAACWGLFNDHAYFGTSGAVCKAWDGLIDNAGDISGTCIQAFNMLGTDVPKRATLMRPTIMTSGAPSVAVALNFDFDLTDNTTPLSFSPTGYATWDNAMSLWDSAIWGGGLVTQQNWQNANGIGRYAATFFKVTCQGIEVQWPNTDIEFEIMPNGFLS